MADNTSQAGTSTIATDDIGGVHFQRVKVTFGPDGSATDVSASDRLPVDVGTVPVTGTFYPATQPISGTVGVSGSVAVTGTFWQATQPVSIAATVAVSGPLTDGQLRATPVPVSLTSTTVTGSVAVTGTFWQATQPVSLASLPALAAGTNNIGDVDVLTLPALPAGSNTIGTTLGPALTKGTQGTTGYSTQDLKDAGRVSKIFSATFTAATTEGMVTIVPITDGTTGTGGTSHPVTSGKRLRLQSMSVSTKNAGAAAQGLVCNLRISASGAVTTSSSLAATCGTGTFLATANIVNGQTLMFPDGLELSGTMQLGISQIGTATAGNTVTLVGYEY